MIIEDLTEQEIFNQVSNHLLTQNAKSIDEVGNCLYRGLNDCKCAIGCLIKDDKYDTTLEGKNVACLTRENLLPVERVMLLAALQSIHDRHPVGVWGDLLINTAIVYKLDCSVVVNFR